ncbi:DUF6944 family repetitive protein [Peribacillus loiseleuriae]|uniref:DUF6944 family repetitive protein n=1 Tax=Peribacillus loiseleuriae TaxID=1679170 RepID=UPI003D01B0D4
MEIVKQGEDLIITGAGFLVAGTIISAIGATNVIITGTDNGLELVARGNAVEGFGNVLQAIGRTKVYEIEGREEEILSIVGCWFQAGGNFTNTVANEVILEGTEEEEGLRVNALGSGVQSVGASLEAVGAPVDRPLESTGNWVIALGSSIDSIANLFTLQDKKKKGDALAVIGSYLEVVGALIELYALTSLREESPPETEDNRYQYPRISV